MIVRIFSLALLLSTSLAWAQDQLTTLPGFKVEALHHTVKGVEGSWVSVCVDGKGDLIASDQYGFMWRITPPPLGQSKGTKVERLKIKAGKAQGLLWAFNSLYFMGGPLEEAEFAAGKVTDVRNLYRARDTKGTGEFDEVTKLGTFESGGEHGPHAIVLSPDGKQLYVVCGNHTAQTTFAKSAVPPVYTEDHLLPRMWDARGHARGILAPGGWVARCNPDGSELEMVSMGYRNEYDLAFDTNGEAFTYDSDMEWDLGMPWYRPTRINHVTSGSEFGWRSGSGKWPSYYLDSLPATLDIGPGSPTGVAFGTGAKFPAKYQRALLAMDWSFGTLYAVHLSPEGASYKAEKEVFLAGPALPLADLVVRPQDGALYLVAGGRKTESTLYRMTYTGSEATTPVKAAPLTELQQLRRKIEEHHRAGDARALEVAWPQLEHADRWIRFAARVAVELQPVGTWQAKALAETRPAALRQVVTALARSKAASGLQEQLVDRLLTQEWAQLNTDARLEWLRALDLVLLRTGELKPAVQQKLLARLDGQFPAGDAYVDRELATTLIYLKSPTIVGKAVEQMYTAKDPQEVVFDEAHLTRGGGYGKTIAEMQKMPTHKQQIHFAFQLRNATEGWTPELREKYFAWFGPARLWKGGNSFPGFLTNARDEALDRVTDGAEKQRLLAMAMNSGEKPLELPRAKGPGKAYTAEDFAGVTLEELKKRDLVHGKQMFAAALCASCHRFGTEGGVGGPDLTGSGQRYTVADLVTAIVDPNKEVSDQYAFTEFTLKDGSSMLGRVAREDKQNLHLIVSFLAPDALTPLQRNKVAKQTLSPVSPMIPGLMNGLNRDEALDLLAFLLLGAK